MADRQFVAPFGTTSTPADWKPPAVLDLLLKTAFARYNGAGAAGSYRPCLRLISDSGHVVVEAVATTTVAAGASADVSWFQDVDLTAAVGGWPNTNQVDTALAFGPWAYWKLNEGLGVTPAIDSSGHGRSLIVLVSNVQGGKSGIVPTSADTSSFVVWSAATNVAPWLAQSSQAWNSAVGSWEYWLNSPGHSPNELNLGVHGTISSVTSRLFRHFLNSSGQAVIEYLDITNTLQTLTFAVAFVDNSTHHLVYVLDGTNITVYKDGAQAAQQAQPAAMTAAKTAVPSLGMTLGGAGSRFYTGYLEHVGWYDKVLTAANVLSLYQAGTQLPT